MLPALAFVLCVLSTVMVVYAWTGIHTERRFLGLLLTAIWFLLLIPYLDKLPL